MLLTKALAADPCPSLFPIPGGSAVLVLSPSAHRVLLRQPSGYTAIEAANAAPYQVIRTIPDFSKYLTPCPVGATFYDFDIGLAAPLPSGGYITAITPSSIQLVEIDIFDDAMNLLASAPYDGLYPLAFADVNGDGLMDIIGVKYITDGEPTLIVSLGTGGVGFQTPVKYSVTGTPLAVVVADLNGDHKPDIVLSDEGAGIVTYINNGDGTFQPPRTVVPLKSFNPFRALAVADLNGDGKPDLAITTDDSPPTVQVALGAGDGTFSAPAVYPAQASDSVAIGDVNADGIPDVVTDGVTILYGDGKGGFPTRRDYAASDGNVILTDFNGDGITDIVYADAGIPAIIAGTAVTVISGLGKGEFAAPLVSLVPNQGASDNGIIIMNSADLNGDGFADLVSLDNHGSIYVLKGAGDGTFSVTQQTAFAPLMVPSAALLADFNNDGKPDLAIVGSSAAAGTVDVLLGNGDGTLQPAISTPTAFNSTALAVGDFNGDGNLDLAVLANSLTILLGRGDGTFTTAATYPAGPLAYSLVAGDFNGDGRIDLVAANTGPYPNYQEGGLMFYAGNGDGTFAPVREIPLPAAFHSSPYLVVTGDFNRDGKPDLAVEGLYGGSGLLILLGRGDGTFSPVGPYPVYGEDIQAADLNGDGILDLIVGPAYLLGNGDGTFQQPFDIGIGNTIAIGDFGGPGKLGVVSDSKLGVFTLFAQLPPPAPTIVVTGAGFMPGPLAADSIATAFGANLPAGNAQVAIRDLTRSSYQATVLYASPSQINFVIPAAVNAGPATVTITGGTAAQTADIIIAPAAPSLFGLNANGLAAAYVTSTNSSGGVVNQQVFTVQDGAIVPALVDVSSGSAYLVLFGTGIRNDQHASVEVNGPEINGLQLVYAGPQPTYAGLDQVNVILPAALAGKGCLNFWIDGMGPVSNTVYICIK